MFSVEGGDYNPGSVDYNPGSVDYEQPAPPISVDFQCTEDGYVGFPGDNTKFVLCIGGNVYLFDCPPGSVWDGNICNWP